MAINLPNATFVGIDGSEVHIARGREMATHASATNVHLESMDITQIQDQFGTFDYIICHGVFSWVPETVREHILRICREQMSELESATSPTMHTQHGNSTRCCET